MSDKKMDGQLLENTSDKVKDDCLLDTVGAICVDSSGRVASAVSSGGIVLKQPGRLGQVRRSCNFSSLNLPNHWQVSCG